MVCLLLFVQCVMKCELKALTETIFTATINKMLPQVKEHRDGVFTQIEGYLKGT